MVLSPGKGSSKSDDSQYDIIKALFFIKCFSLLWKTTLFHSLKHWYFLSVLILFGLFNSTIPDILSVLDLIE